MSWADFAGQKMFGPDDLDEPRSLKKEMPGGP